MLFTDIWSHGDILQIGHAELIYNLTIKKTTDTRTRIHDQRWVAFSQTLGLKVRDI